MILFIILLSVVQGTVVRSQYYSENGQEPQGEISVTQYSVDLTDLGGSDNVTEEKGIASVTTQKFGYKGTPSLKTITSKTKVCIKMKYASLKNKHKEII